MKYGDLIQFEPIETTIKLVRTDERDSARNIVQTFVISDAMAERLTTLVFPQLQWRRPADNKGLLVIGNYGTGKSHLMSMIAAIAEYPELVAEIRNERVKEAASEIAGQFKVIRTEIGAVEMSLRDIVVSQLEDGLEAMGVTYRFPAADQLVNHLVAFEEMMVAFHQTYPEQGLLLVVDELLDYLRAQPTQALVRALGFLREVGEASKELKFRFMAGMQATLFGNPEFQFVADSLRRVQARFEQLLIARRDVKYVVAERLLKKEDEQRAWIREHLQQFSRFYDEMNERMDEFVQLFPIHPDYINVFEQVTVVEKREILKTISAAMRGLLDESVPDEHPGLLSYDNYWMTLRSTPTYHAIPEVGEVVRVSSILEGRIEQGFTRPQYRQMALRIIHALSVHRLTTGGTERAVGVSARELRDSLALYDPLIAQLGGDPAEDLLGQVETVLREISRTVNGQFISRTPESQQYYLDLKKDVDYDALIEKRAASLDDASLDSAYFQAMARILERSENYYPGTHLAWEYELVWQEKKVERGGYLFFGTPNERSTAQPERDFYIYFIQPFEPPPYKDAKRGDELFFHLGKTDSAFDETLKQYAAALELARSSSGSAQSTYEKRAGEALKELVKWLQQHLTTAFEVSCRGERKTPVEWLKGQYRVGSGARANVRDIVNAVGSACFAPHFETVAPDYPSFSVLITRENRPQAALDALRWIKGPTRTQQGAAVLDALGLLDGDRITPYGSPYASYIVEAMRRKGEGQVLNRAELLEQRHDGEYLLPDRFRLEPDWVVVLLAALVYHGDLVLAIPGQKFDATALDELVSTPLADLRNFKHVERPREWNLPALKALFELVGLPPGQAQPVTQGKSEPVANLQAKLMETVEGLVLAQQVVQEGLVFWGKALLTEQERDRYREQLERVKRFLESLQAYNTPAKLKNLRYGVEEIEAQQPGMEALAEIRRLRELLATLGQPASYLAQAELMLPQDDPWVQEAQQVREAAVDTLREAARSSHSEGRQRLQAQLNSLKQQYIRRYLELHKKARLGIADDNRKGEMLQGVRLRQLRDLANIELMPASQLRDFENRLLALKVCPPIGEADLQSSPLCPHPGCSYKPVNEPVGAPASERLEALEQELDALLEEWTKTLRSNLLDPITQQNLDLLQADERAPVEQFLERGKLSGEISRDFLQAVNETLKGLSKVPITLGEVEDALLSGGMPVTPDELKSRFARWVDEQVRGKERSKVRMVLETNGNDKS